MTSPVCDHVIRCGDESGQFATKSWLERVVVMGMGRKPSTVSISTGQELKKVYSSLLEITKCNFSCLLYAESYNKQFYRYKN